MPPISLLLPLLAKLESVGELGGSDISPRLPISALPAQAPSRPPHWAGSHRVSNSSGGQRQSQQPLPKPHPRNPQHPPSKPRPPPDFLPAPWLYLPSHPDWFLPHLQTAPCKARALSPFLFCLPTTSPRPVALNTSDAQRPPAPALLAAPHSGQPT